MLGNKLASADGDSTAPKLPKSKWEMIMATTPVLMTVLATLLAGLASSEMTQAQYYRSLAAQCQSKAGDQWGFFQAKRIRGAGLEQTADLLRPSGEALDASLPGTAARLRKAIAAFLARMNENGSSDKAEVSAAAFAPKTPSGSGQSKASNRDKSSTDAKTKSDEKLTGNLRATARAVQALEAKIVAKLQTDAVKKVWTYLAGQPVQQSVTDRLEENTLIAQACQSIRERKPEGEVTSLLRQIPPSDLQDAIRQAEERAARVEQAARPITRVIDDIALVVNEAAMLGNSVVRAFRDWVDNENPQDLFLWSTPAMSPTSAADTLERDFKAARHSFKARCYEHEARQNQAIAELYELQVRLNSTASERHRERSKHFFYGMLAAQAGVTIASLALALRHKNILWALASLTGMAAIFFGAYVYLCM